VEELSVPTVRERLTRLATEASWTALRDAQMASLERELR